MDSLLSDSKEEKMLVVREIWDFKKTTSITLGMVRLPDDSVQVILEGNETIHGLTTIIPQNEFRVFVARLAQEGLTKEGKRKLINYLNSMSEKEE